MEKGLLIYQTLTAKVEWGVTICTPSGKYASDSILMPDMAFQGICAC